MAPAPGRHPEPSVTIPPANLPPRATGWYNDAAMVGRLAAEALVVAFSALLAGCSLLPNLGISRNRAIAIAVERTVLTAAVAVSVEEGSWRLGHQPVRTWIVTIRGRYLECEGPTGRRSGEEERCHRVDGQAVIHVDYATGEYLGGNVGGPINAVDGDFGP